MARSAPDAPGTNPGPGATCSPDTDDNIYDDPDPSAARYVGKHPGTIGIREGALGLIGGTGNSVLVHRDHSVLRAWMPPGQFHARSR